MPLDCVPRRPAPVSWMSLPQQLFTKTEGLTSANLLIQCTFVNSNICNSLFHAALSNQRLQFLLFVILEDLSVFNESLSYFLLYVLAHLLRFIVMTANRSGQHQMHPRSKCT